MNAVPFDTLKLARGLEAAGLTPQLAAGTAAALAEAMASTDLVTKSDLELQESRIIRRIEAAEAHSDARGSAFEAKMDIRLETMEASNRTMFQSFEAKLELLRRDMTIKLGGMIFVAVGIILAAMRFMPHP